MKRALFTIGVYLGVAIAFLDQLSKWWILDSFLAPHQTMRYVTSFLNVRLSFNQGVTFGILGSAPEWVPYFLVAIALVIVGLLLNWLRRVETLAAAIGLGLIMGGAVGNVIDRFRFGAVVDFLDFHLLGYHWYTFNLADSAIVVGVAFLLLENIVILRKSR